MMRTYSHAAYLISMVFFWLCVSAAQVAQVATGTPPFSSLGGGPFDVVNLGNLNVHFAVPVIHKAGRGMSFDYALSYDGSIWTPVLSSGTTTWQPVSNWGWRGQTEASVGYVVQSSKTVTCRWFDGHLWHTQYYTSWTTSGYSDPFGVFHRMTVITDSGDGINCGGNNTGSVSARDGSGYSMSVSFHTPTVTSRSGSVINAPVSQSGSAGTRTDANGNQITANSSGQFFETLSSVTPVLTVTGSGTPSSPLQFGYIPPANESSGTRVYVKVNYVQYTVKTNFGAASGGNPIAEYGPTSIPLVDNITLPDGNTYSFTYEPTPSTPTSGACTPLSGTYSANCVTARLLSVALPTGGTITYSYSGGANGVISDGSTAGLTRALNGGTWTYTRTQVSGNHWQTTVTTPNDPQNPGSVGDDTVIDFQEDSATVNPTYSFYETQRQAYQGSHSGGTLLLTTVTCYNNNSSSCTTTAVSSPISNKSGTLQYPSSGLQTKTVTNYNGNGLVTETDQYAYGSGGPGGVVRKMVLTYASLGNNILDRPSTVTIKDNLNNVKASTIYTYDEGTPAALTNTPNHISISGSRGNLTTIASQVSDAVTLYRHFTYYDTGGVHTATDTGTTASGGPNLTTYNYPDATSTCGNAFPTSVSEPLSLSRSSTWDCTGGAMTSSTDENGKASTVYYTGTNFQKSADPNYWRPYAATDQLGNPATFSYPSLTVSESTMAFNSNNSVVDHRTTLDVFGRPIIGQTEQGYNSTNYDSVETDYDVMGRPWKGTMPYVGAAGALCTGTCPVTTTTYDALSRPYAITNGGGGTVTYSYSQNDVLQVVSPAPTGEHIKQKQLEYDALGRLTSVCEITSVSGNGNGPCNQTTPQTPYSGFWTQYTYDVLGNMTGVTQNSQTSTFGPQTRTFTFDMAGRMLSEANPETGTVNYTYDSADATCGSYASPGDLVEKKDAMSNYTCFKYDGLHRVTQITYPSGTYASATPTKCFVYDSATVNGTAMSNAKTRLAEAYTTSAASCPGTVTVDEGFSYSARGEVTDVWEKTANSGGYYHTTWQYWANGAINTLSGLPGLPTITYGASDGSGMDGEGRITKVNAASGQNPVTGVTYTLSGTSQPIGSLTQVTFGSADNDTYSFDTNTGRMRQYKFNMGTGPQSQTGALSWNANGTLQQLQITDQINTANSQTCAFGYDDLVRVTSANCGSVWAQTFGFDPFGNLSKSGSASFLPTYTGAPNTSTTPSNQYYSIPGGSNGTSNYYDANGNLKNDVTHSYTWDADGNNTGVDSSVTMIYDAMDRMIEQKRGSTYQQIVYGPGGMKLALMNGQTLVNAFVKLPAGASAVYNSTGLAYYRHSDHLGSSRLSTTPSRTKYYDVAYAPYGEDYNGSGTQDLAYTDENQDTVAGGWSTNLYDFLMRGYRTAHGRWTSPDPAGLGAVNPSDPQSWNRYAYVINNPLTFTDALGLQHGSGSSGQCEQCDPTFVPIWIDVFTFPIGGACFMCGGPGGSLDYGAGQGAGMWQVTTPSVFVGAEQIYDQMVGDAWSRAANPGPGSEPSKPSDVIIFVHCLVNGEGDIGCTPPPQAVAGSQDYVRNAPVDWMGVFHHPIWKSAANTMNQATAAYAIAFTGVAGTATLSGMSTMDFVIGAGNPFHVAYGVAGTWLAADGQYFNMVIDDAASYARYVQMNGGIQFSLPVLYPQAVLGTAGQTASFCFTAACGAFLKGWGF